MTTKLPRNSTVGRMFDLMDKTRKDVDTWENNELKSSNEKLFDQLSNCLAVYEQLIGATPPTRKEFHSLYKSTGLSSTKATSLQTKIVRYVFRSKNVRVSSYPRVLRIAHEQKVDPINLPAWLRKLGGVEEVRRTSNAGESPKALQERLIALAQTALSCRISVIEPVKMPDEFKPAKEATHSFTLAVLLTDSGKTSVVCGLNDERLMDMAFVRLGKRFEKEHAASDSAASAAAMATDRLAAVASIASASADN